MSDLFLFNSRTRTKEKFEPLDPKWIRVYACGPTLHDNPHIGNARPAVVFDQLVRLLKHIYGEFNVSYVRNLTDIDDKIIEKARKLPEEKPIRMHKILPSTLKMSLEDRIREVVVEHGKQFQEDMLYLDNKKPNMQPKATQYIPRMIEMIQVLLDKGHAYVSEGHVLFDAESWPEYGKLSGTPLKPSEAKEPWKRSSLDFVLWKPSPKGFPKWQSPWSFGRPGWHIECSAMSNRCFGNSFDIHCGGKDLLFPHHENEEAQSICCFGGSSAKYWLHNELVRIEGQKMSKSSGQFISLKDLKRQGIPGVAARFAILSTHYRHPLDWTDRTLSKSLIVLNRWRSDLEDLEDERKPYDPGRADEEFLACLKDDLNTPRAISRLHELYGKNDLHALRGSLNFMGLRFQYPTSGEEEIKALLKLRDVLRKKKDYHGADLVRESLNESGVSLLDGTERKYEKNILFDLDNLKWSLQRHLSCKRTNLEKWRHSTR